MRRESVQTWGRWFAIALLIAVCGGGAWRHAPAQATAAASAGATTRVGGTVKTVSASEITVATEKSGEVTAAVGPDTKVVRLAPGTTDLKAAQPATMADVEAGDRVLLLGAPAAAGSPMVARRVVLIKASAIAEQNEQAQAGWQRGVGGIVQSVNATSGTILLASGARTITVQTTPTTIFRRYSPGSARFEDAKKSSLAELQAGDQLRARGERTGEGAEQAMKADEVVSGNFAQLSGTLTSVDAASGEIRFKDLKTKQVVTVSASPTTEIHRLPAEEAARFAARAHSGSAAATATAAPARPEAGAAAQGAGVHRAGGGDLSQAVAKLPKLPISDLKVGDAVMVVGMPSGGTVSALTVLAGVEPILAASPNGSEVALSPWSVGSGAPSGGTEQ